ncbi:unnamed protein product [Dovyalis caffra]|uniref:Uncharacterized protein n=1 Tax=Dovyalis caffra TaxID=77055 RepID=A0AAV1RU40_9ROSI|nr:unnamed protein product [Dovyalis caffra]
MAQQQLQVLTAQQPQGKPQEEPQERPEGGLPNTPSLKNHLASKNCTFSSLSLKLPKSEATRGEDGRYEGDSDHSDLEASGVKVWMATGLWNQKRGHENKGEDWQMEEKNL